jgi:hypothetical protein
MEQPAHAKSQPQPPSSKPPPLKPPPKKVIKKSA